MCPRGPLSEGLRRFRARRAWARSVANSSSSSSSRFRRDPPSSPSRSIGIRSSIRDTFATSTETRVTSGSRDFPDRESESRRKKKVREWSRMTSVGWKRRCARGSRSTFPFSLFNGGRGRTRGPGDALQNRCAKTVVHPGLGEEEEKRGKQVKRRERV